MNDMSKTILDPLNGQLRLSNQLIISKNTIPDDLFRQYQPSNIEIWDIKNGFVHYTIRDIELQDRFFFFSFCFFKGLLDSVTLGFKDQPGMLSWDDWSMEKGIQNRVELDHWLNNEIGFCRVFPWGKAEAYFDPKGGGSGIALRYS